MANDKKKIRIPKSVLRLKTSPKKFAKQHDIKISGKGISKKEKKRNFKKLQQEYALAAIDGLNKAVKIISENPPDNKKIIKIRERIDGIIVNPGIMKRIAKLYTKAPDAHPNMIFLPQMIINTLAYYTQENLSDDEKEIGKSLDAPALVEFCEKILKSQIKRYHKHGIPENMAFHIACSTPTTSVFKKGHQGYRKLIQSLYMIAEKDDVNLDIIFPAICKIDKKDPISKKDFYNGFFSEFILTKSSNKNHSFNDSQKELHEGLIERSLIYLNELKPSRAREILKGYIKHRKIAESYKNDTRRVIKFIDHANSNSSYTNIKTIVQELIGDNSSNELYLS